MTIALRVHCLTPSSHCTRKGICYVYAWNWGGRCKSGCETTSWFPISTTKEPWNEKGPITTQNHIQEQENTCIVDKHHLQQAYRNQGEIRIELDIWCIPHSWMQQYWKLLPLRYEQGFPYHSDYARMVLHLGWTHVLDSMWENNF